MSILSVTEPCIRSLGVAFEYYSVQNLHHTLTATTITTTPIAKAVHVFFMFKCLFLFYCAGFW